MYRDSHDNGALVPSAAFKISLLAAVVFVQVVQTLRSCCAEPRTPPRQGSQSLRQGCAPHLANASPRLHCVDTCSSTLACPRIPSFLRCCPERIHSPSTPTGVQPPEPWRSRPQTPSPRPRPLPRTSPRGRPHPQMPPSRRRRTTVAS
jgi:hypothetical protein